MSQISQKSISGITSITTPTGIDNQFTLHINDTSEALKLDHAGNIHIHNHVNTTGISSASNFKTGTSDLHSAGLNVAYADVDDFVDVGSNIKLGNAGVITATSFVGDGSDLTNLPAGLGTALSATATSPLNKMYYTNAVLGIAATTTVDVPASASAAYTQYADINIATDADLIIADGDDLIPDVLGLADFGTFGGGSAGRLRVDAISNQTANGAPTVQHGLVITGVTTSTTFSGSGASLTNLNGSNIASGTVPVARIGTGTKSTSTFYRGDGTFATVTSTTINNNADNRVITGSGSANTLEGESNLTFNGSLLDVSGSARANNFYLRANGSAPTADASIFRAADNTLAFATASTERLRNEGNGQIWQNYGRSSSDARFKFDKVDAGSCGTEYYSGGAQKAYIMLDSEENMTYMTQAGTNHRFWTNGSSVRMQIDGNGYVTMPGQCSFRATKSGGGFSHSTGTLVWDQNQHNTGSNYNTSNGRFTAPVAGTYIFHAYAIFTENASNDTWDFQKNGSNFAGGRVHYTNNGNGGTWDNVANTCIISLAANDYITLRASSQGYHGGDWTAFCGSLLN